MLRRTTWLLLIIATLLGLFVGGVRPWYSGWGATADEIRRPLPGDEIVSRAADQTTRAITIAAPVLSWRRSVRAGEPSVWATQERAR